MYSLAQVGLAAGALGKVIPVLTQCIKLMPENPQPLFQLAQVRTELKQILQAEQDFEHLISRFPNWAAGFFAYAGFFQSQGLKEKAQKHLEKTIQLDPDHSGAYLALTNLVSMSNHQPLVLAMESLLTKVQNSEANNKLKIMQLHYALGKSNAEQQRYSAAFEHWKQANQLQLTQCQFKVEQMQPFFKQLKKSFAHQPDVTKESVTSNQLKPIFILGLPRSGSTLLEQMLSSHSEIETAGEVNYLSGEVVTQLQKITAKPYPLDVHKLSPKQYQKLATVYLSLLQKHHPGSPFIIDKLPSNFQSVGLIKRILPEAVIIHITRQPEAIALSIFANYFAENEPYFCDLNEFAEYYLSYRNLMDYWRQQENTCLEISYEALVSSPEEEITRLLQNCGLNWQEPCLNFHINTRTIATLSSNQVRQPLHKDSLNEWRHYQDFLKDFTAKIS